MTLTGRIAISLNLTQRLLTEVVGNLRHDERNVLQIDLSRRLKILQINTSDLGGGAEQVAWGLFSGYRSRGQDSRLAVGNKHLKDPAIFQIPRIPLSPPWGPLCWGIHRRLGAYEDRIPGLRLWRYWLQVLAAGWPGIQRELGYEDFDFPGSHRLMQISRWRPDIIHGHNLHSNYFDLRLLARLSRQFPVVMTLHDAWLLSGHCAHSLDCSRWRTGCGQCPDLNIYPAILHDGTGHNWRRKRNIYQRSRLFVATPSRWLMERVKASMLSTAIVAARVIPNGVNLSIFRPQCRGGARDKLGLPRDAHILLFSSAHVPVNPFKDFDTVEQALKIVAANGDGKRIIFIALGADTPSEQVGQLEIRFIPYQQDPNWVACYYNAADVYVHAAKADTFPNVILEAMACGIPVVATAVGGIPEQILHGITGYLTPPGDPLPIANYVSQLLDNDDQRHQMGKQAVAEVQHFFDLEKQIDAYLDWYREILGQSNHSAES